MASLFARVTTLALGAAALAAPLAAGAQAYGRGDYGYGYERGYAQPSREGWRAPRYQERGYDRGYYDRAYYDRGYYDRGPRRCSSGTAGTVIGAIAGGLLGRAVDDRGDHALGTILGAGGGALAGRAVERSNNPGWCR